MRHFEHWQSEKEENYINIVISLIKCSKFCIYIFYGHIFVSSGECKRVGCKDTETIGFIWECSYMFTYQKYNSFTKVIIKLYNSLSFSRNEHKLADF